MVRAGVSTEGARGTRGIVVRGRRKGLRGAMGLERCNGDIAYRHRGGLLMRIRVCRGGWTQVGGVRSSSSVGGWAAGPAIFPRRE